MGKKGISTQMQIVERKPKIEAMKKRGENHYQHVEVGVAQGRVVPLVPGRSQSAVT